MPLNTPTLGTELQTLFTSPPETFAACAQDWADAIENYSLTVVPPSTTIAAAATILNTSLVVAFQAGAADPTGVSIAPLLEVAFVTFATTVGIGMAPAFVATPPPAPVGWAAALAGSAPDAHAAAASKYRDLIDLWMRTGTAVPSAGGPAQPWA